MNTHMIRTLLVDDHALILDGLCAVLEKYPDIDVIAAVRDGREAVKTSLALQPQVVVMDLMMPGLNGIEATRQILAASPQCRCCVCPCIPTNGLWRLCSTSGPQGSYSRNVLRTN